MNPTQANGRIAGRITMDIANEKACAAATGRLQGKTRTTGTQIVPFHAKHRKAGAA